MEGVDGELAALRPTSQSESIGANMKSTIHRRVSRNKIDGKERKHVRRDASGAIKKRWTQKALLVSRVMQAFRAECVRERILRDPSSAHLLQRKHYRVLKHGRASKAPVKEEGEEGRCISDAYKQSACGSCGRRVASGCPCRVRVAHDARGRGLRDSVGTSMH